MLFKSIRWRITIVYLFIIALSLLSIGLYFIWRIESFYMENLQRHMLNEVIITAELFSTLDQNEAEFDAKIDQLCKKLGAETKSRITFIAKDGRVIGDSYESVHLMENHLGRPEVKAALEKGRGVSRRYSSTVDMGMFYVAMVMEGNPMEGIIRLSVPLSFIQSNIVKLRLILLSGLLLALCIAGLLSLRFSRRLINPLDEIGNVAKCISSGDFDHKVTFCSEDELGSLAQTINEMGKTLKEKVRQLSGEKNKLETVMSSMTSGVILCNTAGAIDLINDTALKIFGVEREDVVGYSLQAALRNFVLFENLSEVLIKGEIKSFELNIFFPETKVFQVNIVPVIGSSKEIMGALIVFHDITGIRSLERMRSEFVANVSHELRTPLTVIKGYAETLLEESSWKDPAAVKRILTVIDKEAERLARLLRDLSELSRIESSKKVKKKQEVNLKGIIMEAQSMMQPQAREKGLHVNLHLPEDKIASMLGDPDWLLQLFIDILDNGIKYTPPGGSIDIRLEQRTKEFFVSVSDTGIGIPAKDLPYIFERFYRVDKARSRRLGGTGLGLAIVKHITEAHDGRIEVRSTVGVGTTFNIYLPFISIC